MNLLLHHTIHISSQLDTQQTSTSSYREDTLHSQEGYLLSNDGTVSLYSEIKVAYVY